MMQYPNLKILLASVVMSAALSACSSAVFPEIIEEDDVTLEDVMKKQGKPDTASAKVLKEGETLGADEQNAAYEGEAEDEIFAEIMDKDLIEDKEEKVLAEKAKAKSKTKEKLPEKEIKTVKVAEVKVPAGAPLLSESVFEETLSETQEADADSGPSVTYRLETIYFANGSAAVDPSYNSKIRAAVRQAKANNATIKVLGFASSRTRNTDIVSHKLANLKVSMERAQNVAAALKRAGMKEDDISIEALSDSAPAYLEVMPEGERLNRRAEIYISY
ncbi:MAG: OmpA family protein [Alphaproteobacteria bacterium]|nr:OmpA family protein [Alphaproteobacteria bacterium]